MKRYAYLIRTWLPTVSMLLVSLISYIDRNTLALLAPSILKDTGLNAEQYGFIISAFSIAYMIGNPVWGVLLDRFGLRGGMSVAVGFWTAASAAHAFAGGIFSFAAARALLGFGEGATFPGGLRTAVQTLPASSRSRGIAVAYSGGSLGAIITPILITPVALHWGWRGAFLATGFAGALWLVIWTLVSRSLKLPPKPSTQVAGISPRDPKLWAFMSCYALGGLPLAFVIYSAALYLSQVHHLSQAQLGKLLWIPPLGWEAGYFFWGWISDRQAHRRGKLIGMLGALSLPLAAAPFAPYLPILMFALFFAMFIAAGFVILSIAYATEVFSEEHSGLIAGLGAGSWSALVAIVMPLFGKLFDAHRYSESFAIAAAFPIAGYALWRWLSLRPALSRIPGRI